MILLGDIDFDDRVSSHPTMLTIPMAVSLLSQLITLIDWYEPRQSSLLCLCWASRNWTLSFPLYFLPYAPCSAVDLIRLGGGRLRFLVAKSDPDVSEKISASSCWPPPSNRCAAQHTTRDWSVRTARQRGIEIVCTAEQHTHKTHTHAYIRGMKYECET